MNYQLIIFDADETLFDFKKSEQTALEHTLRSVGVQYEKAYHLELYKKINTSVWRELEQGLLTQSQLNLLRFSRLQEQLGIGDDAGHMADVYKQHLAEASFLYEESLALISELSKNYRLVILSNGLKDVQTGRLRKSIIADYFEEILISEEEGLAKPDPAFFQLAFDRIGFTDKKRALMVGDSLSSDIQGGINFGIDTCLYQRESTASSTVTETVTTTAASAGEAATVLVPQPHPGTNGSVPQPTYIISKLNDLLNIISI